MMTSRRSMRRNVPAEARVLEPPRAPPFRR
jgi:hypothetical protein